LSVCPVPAILSFDSYLVVSRVAFQVGDAASATGTLAAAGAEVVAEPTPTPWHSLNSRLEGPAGLQLTLFSDLPDAFAVPETT
jgi:hypothetical protein